MSKDKTHVWFAGHDYGGKFQVESVPVVKLTDKQVQVERCKATGYNTRLSLSEAHWTKAESLDRYVASLRESRDAAQAKVDKLTEQIYEVLTEIEKGGDPEAVHP